jgi:taurine dioxygenase
MWDHTHTWTERDVLMWDHIGTLHNAIPDYDGRRARDL